MLKKQYLDDKSSGKLVAPPPLVGPVSAPDTGPVLNLAAFQRPVTASAYPVVMGPPVLLSATTAQAQAFGGVPPAAFPPAAPSGYGPHGSGLVSGYGAPSAAVKKAAPSQSLNGQGWYSQTAGRAVNQVLSAIHCNSPFYPFLIFFPITLCGAVYRSSYPPQQGLGHRVLAGRPLHE